MIELLLMADDFTGALDTAIPFSESGICTLVQSDQNIDWDEIPGEVKVLAVNTDSRHCEKQTAYGRIRKLAEEAKARNIRIVYKKTDSVLRGNIGSELAALADAFGRRILFLPAYPELGRTTSGGVQYYNGVPVAETFLGQDAFDPLTSSDVGEIIHRQTGVKTVNVSGVSQIGEDSEEPAICIVDSETREDIERFTDEIRNRFPERPLLLAGCAGFAMSAQKLLCEEKQEEKAAVGKTRNVLIVSGSLNEVAKAQTRKLCQVYGLPHFNISGISDEVTAAGIAAEIREALASANAAVVETQGTMESVRKQYAEREDLDDARLKMSDLLADITAGAAEGLEDYTLIVIGGDTLKRIIDRVYSGKVLPLDTIGGYGVRSRALTKDGEEITIVTKSGGFGEPDTLIEIFDEVTYKR